MSAPADDRGAAMVEYVIVLTVATLAAVTALGLVGRPMADFYLIARGLLLYPV